MKPKRATIELHGMAPDLIPQDTPAAMWNDGHNVLFRNGESVRVPGDRPVFGTAPAVPVVAVYIEASGQGYWVWAAAGGAVYAWDGVSHHDISPTGWAPAASETFTATAINGLAVINASETGPLWWNGSVASAAEALPGWNASWRAQSIRAHKNFLFALGVEQDQRVRWSSAAEAGQIPQEWEPAASNLAGFVDLGELSAPTLDAITLRDSLIVFKQGSSWAFDFVGGTYVFQVRQLFAERGLQATNGLTRGPDDLVLYVTDDADIHVTDGNTSRSVLDGRARRLMLTDVDLAGKFYGATLGRENLGMIGFERIDQGRQLLMFDFSSHEFGFRDMPDQTMMAEGRLLLAPDEALPTTWDTQTESWDEAARSWHFASRTETIDDVVIGGDTYFATVSDAGQADFISGPVSARLDKQGLSFGAAQELKLVTRAWPKIEGQAGDVVSFRFGGQDRTGGPIAWTPAQLYTVGETASLDFFCPARFLAMQVTSAGGKSWRMGTLDLEFMKAGEF